MKKHIAILLFVIFSIDIAGYYLVFSFRQIIIKQNIKYSIKLNLPNELLTLIISTPSTAKEILWKERGEFRYRGNMFDIVRKVIKSGDSIFYYCINDKKETKLFSNLEEYVNKSQEAQKDASSRFQNYLNFHSILFFKPVKEFICRFNENYLVYNYIQSSYLNFIPDILSPPPEEDNNFT